MMSMPIKGHLRSSCVALSPVDAWQYARVDMMALPGLAPVRPVGWSKGDGPDKPPSIGFFEHFNAPNQDELDRLIRKAWERPRLSTASPSSRCSRRSAMRSWKPSRLSDGKPATAITTKVG